MIDAFRHWFANSKVVDEHGEPLVVWHGTLHKFHEFSPARVGERELGFHFGTRKAAQERLQDLSDVSDVWDHDAPIVSGFYLRLVNPLSLPDLSGNWHDLIYKLPLPQAEKERIDYERRVDHNRTLREVLMGLGYDGVTYKNKHEDRGSVSWIAFDPRQIKSATNNTGAYDPMQPSFLAGLERATMMTMTEPLTIHSATYRLVLRLAPLSRGARLVHVTAYPRLAWPVPIELTLYLPEDAEALEALLRSARGGYFAEWLGEHGYDEYGRGDGTWGALL